MSSSLAGSWVGGYRLLRPLGTGGSGTVWEAEDAANNKVALKLLHPTQASTEQSRSRLAREARLVNQIPGTGIARVIDFESEDTSPFVVTELVEGPTLAQIVAERPLSLDESIHLALLLEDLLNRVHSVGIVHRDLKPSNIISSEEGPVLIDFGIAQSADDTRLTQTGKIMGTPGYVSPALLSQNDITFDMWREGDWWALNALLLSSMTGRPPFGSGTNQSVLHRIFEGEPDTAGLPSPIAQAFINGFSNENGQHEASQRLVDVMRQMALQLAQEPETTVISAGGGSQEQHPKDNDETELIEAGTQILGASRPVMNEADVTRNFGQDSYKIAAGPNNNGIDATQVFTDLSDVPANTAIYPSSPYVPPQEPLYGGGTPGSVMESAFSPTSNWAQVPQQADYVPPFPSQVGDPSFAANPPAVAPPLPGSIIFSILLAGALSFLPTYFSIPGIAVALIILAVTSVLGVAHSWRETRRYRQGGMRNSDTFMAALLTPRHVLFGLIQLVPGLVVATLLGCASWMLIGFGLRIDNSWLELQSWLSGTGTVSLLQCLGSSFVAFLTVIFTPTSTSLRRGESVILSIVLTTRLLRISISVLICGLLALGLALTV